MRARIHEVAAASFVTPALSRLVIYRHHALIDKILHRLPLIALSQVNRTVCRHAGCLATK